MATSIHLVLLLAIPFVSGQDCFYSDWSFEDSSCPGGTEEMWKRVVPNAGPQYSPLCCTPGTPGYKNQKGYVTSCLSTGCESSTSGDICSTLPSERWVKGRKLQYEETMRDSCTRTSGKAGVTALCCVKNSQEGLLMTTLGAEQNEFPHIAKLKLPGNCGGTIYNKRWIITASHCIVDEETGEESPPEDMEVVLGTNNADAEGPEFIYKVKRAIPHYDYSGLPNSTYFKDPVISFLNDIALLELDHDIKFGPNIKALEVAPKGFNPFEHANQAVIVGWGTTDTLALSAHLQKANFIMRPDDRCEWAWGSFSADGEADMKLCVGGIFDGKWSPTAGGGDSGGPAICRKKNGHPVLCGVTSYGGSDEACAKNNDEASCKPSVYAEVANYVDWIQLYAGKQDKNTFYQPYLYGRDLTKGEAEHQVHITSKSGKSCGGTLIAPNFVLTAQQCVVKDDGETPQSGVKVTAAKGKTFGVAGVVPLADFKMVGKPINIKRQGNRVVRADNLFANDLALIKLDGKATVNPNKLPQIPQLGESFDEGVEYALPRNTTRGNKMRARDFRILDPTDCQNRMNRLKIAKLDIKVNKNIMCGVEKYSGGSTCDRELGGGLICKGRNGKDVLCGVQVFRLCEMSIPNGFFNLAYYGYWVKAAMAAAQDM